MTTHPATAPGTDRSAVLTPVIVTGGASGIGAACARALADVGRPVALWDLDLDRTRAVAAAITDATGTPAIGQAVDVGEPETFDAAVAVARDRLGPIGGLVSAAGIVDSTPMSELSYQAWERVIQVDLSAYGWLVKATEADLRSQAGSAVVGIASINALMGQGAIPSYTAAKAGMLGLTYALADQLGPAAVRVNSVCPGYIETPMLAWSLEVPQRRHQMSSYPMLKRLGQPEEIASVVRFLLSADASYVTGATIVVDGGVMASSRIAPLPE